MSLDLFRFFKGVFYMVLTDTVELNELKTSGNHFFPDIIKFCIDKKRRVVCIDDEMHIEMEHLLYDNGSEYEDIYGGNILIDRDPWEIIWEAHPNIERNRALGGHGRLLEDTAVINELTDILHEWVK